MKQLVVVVICTVLFSCATNTGSKEPERSLWMSVSAKENILPPAQSGALGKQLKISIEMLSFAGNDKFKKTVNEALYDGLTPENYSDEKIRNSESAYLEFALSSAAKNSASLDWYYTEKFVWFANEENYSVIEREKEYFFGGAHPSYTTQYYIFDAKNEKLITLKNMFKPETNSYKQLTSALEIALREKAGLLPQEALSNGGYFADNIEPSEIVYPRTGGLVFYYNTYDIAPYSSGPIEIYLPFEKINGALTKDGRTLVKAFTN